MLVNSLRSIFTRTCIVKSHIHAVIGIRLISSESAKIEYPSKLNFEYKQGQEVGKLREYFYFIDHQGQLFLDDTKIKNFTTCYKEQQFLEHFYRHLRENKSHRYEDVFPFLSLCQNERNFLRCEDLPFVITHLDENSQMVQVNQIHSAQWLFHFDPERLYYNSKNGRLYYLFEGKEIIKGYNFKPNDPKRLKHLDHIPCKIGLVKSDLNIHLMNKTKPIKNGDKELLEFEYKDKRYILGRIDDDHVYNIIKKHSSHSNEV